MDDIWKSIGCAVTFGMMVGCATQNEIPKPSEPKKITLEELAGPDENQNGIRDDVEVVLIREYSERRRTAAFLTAKDVQTFIIYSDQPDKLYKEYVKSVAADCIVEAFGDDIDGSVNLLDRVRELTLNTAERRAAYVQAVANLNDTSYETVSQERIRELCI